jgi:acyl-coenzyme A synthetase/AMP-(fatty) acid ligase
MVENYGLLAPDAHFYNVYGPTELTINCFSIRLDDKLSLKDFSDEVPIGECFEHLTYAFIDTEGFATSDGELCVAGAQAMKGYLGDPELTASSFVSLQVGEGSVMSFYRTGDLAFETQGQVYVRGRTDGLVKNKGYRVHVDEISRAVETAPWVAQACAVVSGGGDLVVYVKPDDNRTAGDDEIRTLIMRSLPARLMPDRLVFLENFPLNQSGKVDRKSLASLSL